MKQILGSVLVLSAVITALRAQTQDPPPVPYVASVKKSAEGFGAQLRLMPGTISARGVPVRLLMRQAFGQLQDQQVVGGPDWINSDRFDIEARIEGGGPMNAQVIQSVLRQILDERFALKVHREQRELPIYALVLARSDGRLGPNLKPTSDACAAMMAQRGRGPSVPAGGRGTDAVDRGGPPRDGGPGRGRGIPPPVDFDAPAACGQRMGGVGRIRAGGTSMDDFAAMISGTAQRVVVNKTGLTGYYDLSLTYAPVNEQLGPGLPPPGAPALPPIDPDAPNFFTALQEQLGLKLDSQRGPVEVVVIDSIQPPTEN